VYQLDKLVRIHKPRGCSGLQILEAAGVELLLAAHHQDLGRMSAAES
jgi:hypothetical protein